jgi:hypothetical protein
LLLPDLCTTVDSVEVACGVTPFGTPENSALKQ